jgi:hypothetical protein
MDLSNLTAADIESLKAQLGLAGATDGRSPLKPRQLHDLRLVPTKDDPRPTFFWSADVPRNAEPERANPHYRLMWHAKTGQEITVTTAKEIEAKKAEGYILTPPANAEAPDAMEMIRQQLESLSPEDRKVLIAAAQKDRLAKVQEAMAGLSEAELAALAASLEPAKAKRSA